MSNIVKTAKSWFTIPKLIFGLFLVAGSTAFIMFANPLGRFMEVLDGKLIALPILGVIAVLSVVWYGFLERIGKRASKLK